MIGPTLGSWVLLVGDWYIIFILQGAVAAISFIGVLKIPETNPDKQYIPVIKMAGPYLSLFKNKHFLILSLIFSISMCPFFAYIAASADIFITGFNTSEQAFGFYFAVNALCLMAGSYTCMKLVMRFNDLRLIRFGFVCMVVGGVILSILPDSHLLFFLIPMCLITFGFGLTRPLAINLILEKVNQHVGSASSLMMFFNFIFGALSMWIISLCGEMKIMAIGLGAVGLSILTLVVLGFMVMKRNERG